MDGNKTPIMKYPDSPPTDKQLSYLKELYEPYAMPFEPPKTRKEASIAIDRRLEELNEGWGAMDD
jgi:hypothetical protein